MKLFRTCALVMPWWLVCACHLAPPAAAPVAASRAAGSPRPPSPPQPAAPSVSIERMSEITRVLASDEFQGRSMGTASARKKRSPI